MVSALGTAIGNPLTFPFIWGATLALGRLITEGQHPGDVVPLELSRTLMHLDFETLWEPLLKPMTAGAIPLGLAFAFGFYFVTRSAVATFQDQRRKRLAERAAARRRQRNPRWCAGQLMIIGLGSDLIDIRRIERTLERGERFTNRVFTEIERAQIRPSQERAASYAKRFAAKEACAKALGNRLARGVFWRDMGVVNLPGGKPTKADRRRGEPSCGHGSARPHSLGPSHHHRRLSACPGLRHHRGPAARPDRAPLLPSLCPSRAISLRRVTRAVMTNPFPTEGDMSVSERSQKKSGGLGETISVIVQALLLALVIRTFLFQPFSIPSGSMRPTLLEGDYLFVTKWAYGYSRNSFLFSPPLFRPHLGWRAGRGDVVVFKFRRTLRSTTSSG